MKLSTNVNIMEYIALNVLKRILSTLDRLMKISTEDGFFINDPNRRSNSKKQWEYKDIQSQIKNLWGIYNGE